MSSWPAVHEKSSQLFNTHHTNEGDSLRAKRNTKSERRRRQRNRSKQQSTACKEKLGRSSSLDSGAGGEDEGSASDTEFVDEKRIKEKGGRRSFKDSTSGSPKSSARARSTPDKVRCRYSKSEEGTRREHSYNSPVEDTTISLEQSGDKDNCKSGGSKPNTSSDSAISSSTLPASIAAHSISSPLLSSPYLSDQSRKSSNSSAHTRSPQLSRSLKRKQERLKRQLDLSETRACLEQLRFTEKAYQSNRMMLLTSSLHRRRQQQSRSASAKSRQRSKSPNAQCQTQSFPIGKESRQSLRSKRDSSASASQMKRPTTPGGNSPSSRHVIGDDESASTQSSRRSPKAAVPYTAVGMDHTDTPIASPLPSSSSPRMEPSPADDGSNPQTITNGDSIASNSHDVSQSFKLQLDYEADPDLPVVSKEERKRQRSSRRRNRADKSYSKQGKNEENCSDIPEKPQKNDTLEIYDETTKSTLNDNHLALPSDSLSSRSEDDFEKLAKRFESVSPREANTALQVETRMVHAMDAVLRDGIMDMPSTVRC